MRTSLLTLAIAAFAAVLCVAGCEQSFDPYAEVRGLRVLAIGSTLPDVRPTETATIEALVTTDATYQWSWCPLPFSGPNEEECPISEVDLAALIASSGSTAEAPPYDLGTEAQIEFQHTIPPELLAGVCAQIAESLPEGIPAPPCDGLFSVSIRVVVTSGEQVIAATRELGLLYAEERQPNINPSIVGGEISVRGAPPFILAQDQPTTAVRNVDYALKLTVDESSPEVYPAIVDDVQVEKTEGLTISWFYEGGAMDKERSSFIDGFTDLENLGANEFSTPLAANYAAETSRLFFVLRDERGGTDWFVAPLELVE